MISFGSLSLSSSFVAAATEMRATEEWAHAVINSLARKII